MDRFSSREELPSRELAPQMTASCKAGVCGECSGGVYRPRKIAGMTRQWFVECACDCHGYEDAPE